MNVHTDLGLGGVQEREGDALHRRALGIAGEGLVDVVVVDGPTFGALVEAEGVHHGDQRHRAVEPRHPQGRGDEVERVDPVQLVSVEPSDDGHRRLTGNAQIRL